MARLRTLRTCYRGPLPGVHMLWLRGPGYQHYLQAVPRWTGPRRTAPDFEKSSYITGTNSTSTGAITSSFCPVGVSRPVF